MQMTKQNQKRVTLIHEQIQTDGDVKSVLSSRGGSSMASVVSQLDDDLQSLNSLDDDIAFQSKMADDYSEEVQEDRELKIEKKGRELIRDRLEEMLQSQEKLGGLQDDFAAALAVNRGREPAPKYSKGFFGPWKNVDAIIKEVSGGAHRFPEDQALLIKDELILNLDILNSISGNIRRKIRNEKFLNITSNI